MNKHNPKSLIFKVVVFHLLLFVIFFVLINIFSSRVQLSQLLLLLFFATFLITSYFAFGTSRSIKSVTHTVDRISHGDFSVQPNDQGSSKEIEELSKLVAKLGRNIKISQDNLENQHNQLNGILAYMTDGVIATDRRGNVVLANPAALRYLSTTSEDILTKNIAEALNINNYYAFRDLLERTPDISIDSTNSEGETFRLRINFSIFRRETGYISGIVAVLHDVTEAEKLEREQRLFVSNVSHELRTPLTTIKSYLETLNEGAVNDPETAKEFIEITLYEANHMAQMINDILELSRIDMKRTVLQKEMVNANAFITHTVNRFKQMMKTDESHALTFETRLPDEELWTELDTSKMNQVIDNILTNAVKYSPHGGKVLISLESSDRQMIIRISDQGMGIPEADLPKIFDRFYRVDKSRTHDSGGTGLGLSIAYDIVKLHEGTIGVKSDGKHGTEFAIILPYTPLRYFEGDFEDEDFDSEFLNSEEDQGEFEENPDSHDQSFDRASTESTDKQYNKGKLSSEQFEEEFVQAIPNKAGDHPGFQLKSDDLDDTHEAPFEAPFEDPYDDDDSDINISQNINYDDLDFDEVYEAKTAKLSDDDKPYDESFRKMTDEDQAGENLDDEFKKILDQDLASAPRSDSEDTATDENISEFDIQNNFEHLLDPENSKEETNHKRDGELENK